MIYQVKLYLDIGVASSYEYNHGFFHTIVWRESFECILLILVLSYFYH